MKRPDSTNRQTMHYRARKHRKDACEQCGSTDSLEVHHKDEDRTNNNPANLETLCGPCHRSHHGVSPMLAARRAAAKTSLTDKQTALLAAIRTDWLTAEELADRLGSTKPIVQNSLIRLRARGFVDRRPSGLKGARRPRWEWRASADASSTTSKAA